MAKKILLAEDSVTMQKVVQMTFEAEDVTVTTVATAAEALARAREMDPDVVLADLSMPGENGYDICAALKQRGGPPVLLLHGLTQSLDAERARQVGADADLAKPFESQALIDLVNDLLEKAAAAAPETHLEVKSLASPIEADVVIDGDLFGTPRSPPAPAPAPAVVAPRSPPVPAPAPAV
ncbi:MAG: response regulator, partial [Deltaproteobacteria bacterium]|nr:response regulator [Deltaproteobacteria bacterium]